MSDSTSDDQGPIDLLQLRLNEGTFEIDLQADVFEDPAVWGEILAEVAGAVAQTLEKDPDEAAAIKGRIQAAFNDSISRATGDSV